MECMEPEEHPSKEYSISYLLLSRLHLPKDLQKSHIFTTTLLTKIWSPQGTISRCCPHRKRMACSAAKRSKAIPTSRFGPRRWKYSGGPSDNILATPLAMIQLAQTIADAGIPECVLWQSHTIQGETLARSLQAFHRGSHRRYKAIKEISLRCYLYYRPRLIRCHTSHRW